MIVHKIPGLPGETLEQMAGGSLAYLRAGVDNLPREIVIYRLTGDDAKRNLLASLWDGDEKRVRNTIHRVFIRDDVEKKRLFYGYRPDFY